MKTPSQIYYTIQFKSSVMPRQKAGHNISSNHIGRIKKYQEYFDQEKTYFMTPHARSVPKKKSFFNQHSQYQNSNQNVGKQNHKSKTKRSGKKIKKNNHPLINTQFTKRKQDRIKQASPSISKHRHSKYDHSIQKDYDSPSKDNEQLDFILADRPVNKKKQSLIEKTIDAVYNQLTNNRLNQAIEMLSQALQKQPLNYDLNYLLGVCHLINGSYDEAIYIFNGLLNRKTRKNIFLLLSVCFKKKQDYEETQKILNQCIRTNPKSYQAYIYRGKLYLRLKKYRDALQDFQKAIKINADKQIAYIGKGDCLRLTQKFEEAKAVYMKALHMTKKPNPSILLRKAICNMQLKRYDPAFDDIQILLQLDPQNSEALYFKGLIYNKQKMQNQAIICYEQAIKQNTNKKAVTRSIYELAKIKIQHRDYYEALYTLQRAKFLDIEEKVVRKFKLFTQGVTQMMKKNFDMGVKILSELIEQDKQKSIGNFLKPLVYSCRSYGYMSLSKFPQAKQDLQKMQNQFSLDIPNLYNKFICEGIICCNQQKYQQSLAFFSKANRILPTRIEPYFYKAVTLISFISKLIPKQLVQKQQQYIFSALKTIQKCDKSLQSNHSLYLVKAFLFYASGDLQKSLENLQESLKQPIKWQSFVFYLNGLILGQWGKYEEAIDQFNKVINMHSKQEHKQSKSILPEVYLNKARCLLLTNQVNAAFHDLQDYMGYPPSSPQIHIWAGHMLFWIGAAEDAAKAYSNINNINKNSQVLMYRAKCYLSSKDVISTLNNLKLILENKYDSKIFFDYNILQALRECSDQQTVSYEQILNKMKETKQKAVSTGESPFGQIFKEADYQFYKGVAYFYNKNYENAAKNFKRSLKLMQQFIAENVQKTHELLDFYRLSFNNFTYNYAECQYNIAIAQLMAGNLPKAISSLKSIIQKSQQDKIRQDIQLFINLLQKEISKQFERRNPPSEEQQAAQLYPFPFENRLCSIFPQFILPLSNPVQTKLFFCLPRVQKPDLRPRFDSKLFSDINMSIIDIRPQAPWIRRSEDGVIFTDDIIGCEIQLSQDPESGSQSQHQGHQQYEVEESEQENVSQGNQVQEIMDPGKLRDFLRLDPAIEARLSKIPKNQ